MSAKPKMLILGQYYRPAFRAGGAAVSLSNFVDAMADHYEISVICCDRDLGSAAPYDLPCGEWYDEGKAKIWYERLSWRSPLRFLKLMRSTHWDFLYVNSYFNVNFSFFPRLFHRFVRLPGTPKLVLAPRGEFASGALAISGAKKKLYLRLNAGLGLHRNITVQASVEHERQDIISVLPKLESTIKTAPDLTASAPSLQPAEASQKNPGSLSIVSVARIHPIKNILAAIQMLQSCKSEILMRFIGPAEDAEYLDQCKAAAAKLPKNIKIEFAGAMGREAIHQSLSQSDIFYLPTLGENFGHAIFEALAAGTPVIISDQTVWRELYEKRAGFDIPLDEPDKFAVEIDRFGNMDEGQFAPWRIGAHKVAANWNISSKSIDRNIDLFI